MRVALGLVLLVDLFIPNLIFAQLEDVQQESKPELSLRLHPENFVDGVPHVFRFALTNIGDRDLRLPPPSINCGNESRNGSVWLDETWAASAVETSIGRGEASCNFGSQIKGRPEPSLVKRHPESSLIQRARGWTLLRPGESIYIAASATMLHFETTQPGLYQFSGTYVPPSLTNKQLQLLSRARINVPQHKAKSERLQYFKSSY